MSRRGFTLIELLIFMALFAIAIIGLITFFITVTRIQSRETSANDVETQGQSLLQKLQYYVQSARLVSMPQDTATSTLTLRESVAANDPTVVNAASGTLYITQGAGGTPQALTANTVTLSNLTFTRHYNQSNSSTPYGTDSVAFSFTLAASTTNATMVYSQSFQSSANVLSPVEAIALLQQNSSALAGSPYTSISSTFPTATTAGDLLIAVVSNTGSSAATISVADTAGNTWTKVANPAWAANSQEFAIFAAPNIAATSSEEITASFGSSVAGPSLFIYEYRDAVTSTPFDASSSLITASTTFISSGSASPTSTVELVFGAAYLNPATGGVTPGPGFTLETSSTVSNTYVEDEDIYVTGAVAATWSYSGGSPPTTSSSAAVVTFK
jgi:type II secretory pathway pseudopilin PulG